MCLTVPWLQRACLKLYERKLVSDLFYSKWYSQTCFARVSYARVFMGSSQGCALISRSYIPRISADILVP